LLVFLPRAENLLNSNVKNQSDVRPQAFYRDMRSVTLVASLAPRRTASRRVFPAWLMATTEKDFDWCLLCVLFVSAFPCTRRLDSLRKIAIGFPKDCQRSWVTERPRDCGVVLLVRCDSHDRERRRPGVVFLWCKVPFFTPQKNQKNRNDCSKTVQLPLMGHLAQRVGSVFSPVGSGRFFRKGGAGGFLFRPAWTRGNSLRVRHLPPVGSFGGEKAV
jgi:hypothetical protein